MKRIPVVILALLSGHLATAHAAGNIDAGAKYAWSETTGWLNLNPTHGGVSVFDDHLEGLAWAENFGWVKFGSYSGGGYHTYANSAATDYGVNLNGAALSGYAFSETAGWIRFDPTGGGVTLDPATGLFDGWAWSENLGWIHFKSPTSAYQARFAPSPQVAAVVPDATDPLKLRTVVEGSGIHLTGDGGATWSAATTQPSDRRLKAAVASGATLYVASHGSGVFESHDGGQNFNACANTGLDLRVYALTAGANGTLYAATKGGVFASADCASWGARSSGLPNSAGLYAPTVLAADPVAPTALYAGIEGRGVYRSSDGGNSWSAAGLQPAHTALRALLVKPGNGTTLFAATYGGGLFKSVDGAANWRACAAQPTSLNALSLAMDAGGKLYAGTEAGVFTSSDDCASWSARNSGLPN